jgi:hypothetical protein
MEINGGLGGGISVRAIVTLMMCIDRDGNTG